MRHTFLKYLMCIVQAAVLSAGAASALASDPTRYKVVQDVGIYLGIVPTDLIMQHPREHTERTMHGGIPLGKHHHHVMIALFDNKTGGRITDAKVTAHVAESGLAGTTKELQPMTVAGAMTYGNFFDMRVSARYRIFVQVRRPGSARSIDALFEYTHHP